MSSGTKGRLLVVDDEPDIVTVLTRGLSANGFQVDAFANPVDALANYQPQRYSAIILDVRMPNMSGFELARKIWKDDPEAQICFLTAYEVYEQEVKWVFPSLKSYCFIKKPLSVSDLVAHIYKHLYQVA